MSYSDIDATVVLPEGIFGGNPGSTPDRESTPTKPRKRFRILAGLRISFALIWFVDAWMKWQTAFAGGVGGYRHLLALVVAVGDTGVAIALVSGVFPKATYSLGAVLAMTISSTGEGPALGVAGSTGVGTGIIYSFVFLSLWVGCASSTWSRGRHVRRLGAKGPRR